MNRLRVRLIQLLGGEPTRELYRPIYKINKFPGQRYSATMTLLDPFYGSHPEALEAVVRHDLLPRLVKELYENHLIDIKAEKEAPEHAGFRPPGIVVTASIPITVKGGRDH